MSDSAARTASTAGEPRAASPEPRLAAPAATEAPKRKPVNPMARLVFLGIGLVALIAAAIYGVELLDAHDAGADAIAAGRVAQAIARRYSAQLGADVTELHGLQVGWCADQAASFQEYMRRTRPDFTTSGAWPER